MPLISILPNGEAVQVLPKPGKGLSLQQIGKVEIRRSSLVEFDADRQKWYIKFIDNSRKCCGREDGIATELDFRRTNPERELCEDLIEWVANSACYGPKRKAPKDHVMMFETYDQGVKMEIYLLESWRKAGLLSED